MRKAVTVVMLALLLREYHQKMGASQSVFPTGPETQKVLDKAAMLIVFEAETQGFFPIGS